MQAIIIYICVLILQPFLSYEKDRKVERKVAGKTCCGAIFWEGEYRDKVTKTRIGRCLWYFLWTLLTPF